MPTRATSRLAFACTVSVLGGLVVPLAAFASLNRAIGVWVAIALAIGLILGGIRSQRTPTIAIRASIAAIFVPGAAIGFYWVRWLATWLKNPDDPRVLIPMFSGHVGPTDSWVLLGLGALALTGFLASLLVVFLVTLAAEPMTEAIRKALSFGPEGFDRVNKVLVAISAVVATLLALFSFVGTP